MPGDAPVPPTRGPVGGTPPPTPERRLAQLRGLVAAGGPAVILRPLVDLRTRRLVAVEARPEFPDDGDPEEWYADAGGLGVTTELELAVVAAALHTVEQLRPTLPADVGLWVTASPATVCAPRLGEVLGTAVVPVTVSVAEQAIVADHPGLLAATSALRRAGVRLAVDGVAAGYAGLRYILRLHPDVVKLGRSLTHGIHHDLARVELTRAVVRVTGHLGASVVAAGIEQQAEVDALLALGITVGQGPGLPDAVAPHGPAGDAPPAAPDGVRDPQELIRSILDLIVRVTGLETAYLTVMDPEEVWLEHRFVCNTGTLEVPEGLTIPWIDSLCKRCRDAGLLWTSDVPGDLPPIPLGKDAPIQTFVSVPVALHDGRTAGTLCAMSSQERDLDHDMLAELAFFARLLAEQYPRGFSAGPAAGAPTMHGYQLAAGEVERARP